MRIDVVCIGRTSYGRSAVSEEVGLGLMEGVEEGVSRAATAKPPGFLNDGEIVHTHLLRARASRIACPSRKLVAPARERLRTS